jgi:hypothetical protein
VFSSISNSVVIINLNSGRGPEGPNVGRWTSRSSFGATLPALSAVAEGVVRDYPGDVKKPRHVSWITLAAALAGLALAACEPAAPADPAGPGGATTALASAAADLLTAPGRTQAVTEALVAAAGSAHAVKVEFTATTATLNVVIGDQVHAWAWRDGAVQVTDTDVTYEGQAIFDPRPAAPADLAGLFATAALQAGSDRDQRLQIGEYSDGRVFYSVTTNPESSPVFFRLDGSLVATLDFTAEAGLAEGLADVTAGQAKVLAVGLDAQSGGLYALIPGPAGDAVRTVRMPSLPVHNAATSEASDLRPFDPAAIDPAAIADVLARLPDLVGGPVDQVSFTIERRGANPTPYLTVTADGHEVRALLSGAVLPP